MTRRNPFADSASGASLSALDRVRRMDGREPVYSGFRRRAGTSNLGQGIQYTGAGEDPRDPHLLGSEFSQLVTRHGWKTSLGIGQLMQRWESIVGESVAQHCAIVECDPPRLIVRASSTNWATQLQLLEGAIVQRLAEELGSGQITEIQIDSPIKRTFKKGRLSVPGRGPRDTYG